MRLFDSRPRRVALWLVAASLAAGCGDGIGPALELQKHRITWEQARIADYTLVVFRGCECLYPEMTGPVNVVVRGSAVQSRTYQDGTAVPASYAAVFPDVPGLFAIIEDAIRRNAATLTVQYDPVSGVPRSIFIDYDRQMADDEMGYTAQLVPSSPG